MIPCFPVTLSSNWLITIYNTPLSSCHAGVQGNGKYVSWSHFTGISINIQPSPPNWHGRHTSVVAVAAGRCAEPQRRLLSVLQHLAYRHGRGPWLETVVSGDPGEMGNFRWWTVLNKLNEHSVNSRRDLITTSTYPELSYNMIWIYTAL